MQEELFTTTELKSFGNYLLSRERAITALASDEDGNILFNVATFDIPDWKAKHGEAGVAIIEGPSPQPDAQARLSPPEMLQEIIKMAERPSPLAGISFKAKGNTGGESEGPSPQPEKPRTVVLVDTPLVL